MLFRLKIVIFITRFFQMTSARDKTFLIKFTLYLQILVLNTLSMFDIILVLLIQRQKYAQKV